MRFLSAIAGLAVLTMILLGTWPIILGKEPVKPLVDPAVLEDWKDRTAEAIEDFRID